MIIEQWRRPKTTHLRRPGEEHPPILPSCRRGAVAWLHYSRPPKKAHIFSKSTDRYEELNKKSKRHRDRGWNLMGIRFRKEQSVEHRGGAWWRKTAEDGRGLKTALVLMSNPTAAGVHDHRGSAGGRSGKETPHDSSETLRLPFPHQTEPLLTKITQETSRRWPPVLLPISKRGFK